MNSTLLSMRFAIRRHAGQSVQLGDDQNGAARFVFCSEAINGFKAF
jgi:hypothetical protein